MHCAGILSAILHAPEYRQQDQYEQLIRSRETENP